ncbi:TerD family protein [Streptomyces sp. SKN60]|uniref:TerD family protein n=1 Tax=Streptomyces sp. SKN60 TaxID=2855506 RepID=UPI0022468477|nr:TerD family protein [Streptomyces sp. SKN60]MCX2181861.1 TerD family protein [Streptomyces sp. SKN60]
MSGLNKGVGKVEVALKWDPSPAGSPAHDLDLVAAVYAADAPYGPPAYLVHFDSRSPDGTITLQRDSRTGQGLGYDEAMTVELTRLAERYARVVVGVAIQQGGGRLTFGEVARTGVRVREGYTDLLVDALDSVADATAATIAEFVRDGGAGGDGSGEWLFRPLLQGFDIDPSTFGAVMGERRA